MRLKLVAVGERRPERPRLGRGMFRFRSLTERTLSYVAASAAVARPVDPPKRSTSFSTLQFSVEGEGEVLHALYAGYAIGLSFDADARAWVGAVAPSPETHVAMTIRETGGALHPEVTVVERRAVVAEPGLHTATGGERKLWERTETRILGLELVQG